MSGKRVLVSYATADFIESQRMLSTSALNYGIDVAISWSRTALERSAFYMSHKAILDAPRGGGYWLWKPYILMETSRELDAGDVLIYSDAGIEIIGDVRPLVEICLANNSVMLFRGHYDRYGPNECSRWTKRDCFVALECDHPSYYRAPMLDASFIIVTKCDLAICFLSKWLALCCRPELLTDAPNIYGLANCPEFLDHRHDQSLLSLLAAKQGVETFRHPSQFGNHLKLEAYRQRGEWIQYPYGSKGTSVNSPYNTILNHHRRRGGHT